MLTQQSEKLTATLLTATTRLRANAAMLVHLSVPFALVSARVTSGGTCLELRPQQLRIGFSLTRKNLPGRVTNASTVQVGADAATQIRNHIFGEAGVGAGCARCGTVETRVDTVPKCLDVQTYGLWVSSNYLLTTLHGCPQVDWYAQSIAPARPPRLWR